MIQKHCYDYYQLMIHQGVNTKTNGVDRLFPQQCVVDPSYFSIIQGTAHEILR